MLVSTSVLTGSRIRLMFVGISVILAAAACGTGVLESPPTAPGPTAPPTAPPPPSSVKATAPEAPMVQHLAGKVSVARAVKHLQALQKIADEHGGNRASGTSGYVRER